MTPLIAFDLDGTLVDSRLDLAESANELLSSYGADPLAVDDIVAMVGEGARVLVERALLAAGIRPSLDAALATFLTIYDRRLLNHTAIYPGVDRALRSVPHDVPMAVLTNKPAHHTARLIEALGLAHWFRAGILGGDTPLGRKPDPAGLMSLMHRAGAEPRSTLMVGDSRVDIDTAVRAGTRFCLAGYGFGGATLRDVPPEANGLLAPSGDDMAQCLGEFLAPWR